MSASDKDRREAASLIMHKIAQEAQRTYLPMLFQNTTSALIEAISHSLGNTPDSDPSSLLHDVNAKLTSALGLPITLRHEHFPQVLDLLTATCRQTIIEATTDAIGEGCVWDDCDPVISDALSTLNVDPASLPGGILELDAARKEVQDLRDYVIGELSTLTISEVFRRTKESGLLFRFPCHESVSRIGMDNHHDREHHHTQTPAGLPVHIEIAREFSNEGFEVHSVRATLCGEDNEPIGYACFGVFGLEDFLATGPETLIRLINRVDERFSRMTPLRMPSNLVFPLSRRGRLLFGYHLELAGEYRGAGRGIDFAKACVAALKAQFPDLRSLVSQVWPLEYVDVAPRAMPFHVRRGFQDDSARLFAYLSQHNDAFSELLSDNTGAGLCLSFPPDVLHPPPSQSASQKGRLQMSLSPPTGDFRNRIPVLHSQMLDEYLKSPGVEDTCLSDLNPSIYEFEWGFIGEFPFLGGYVWEVVAKGAWETGVANWYDRFLTAYKNDIFPVETAFEDSLPEKDRFHITFDDGRANFTSMSFACLNNPEEARKHFADAYIDGHLPDLMKAVFDPKHQFETDWHCVAPGFGR